MKKYLLRIMGAALHRPCSECRYDQDLPCLRCGYPRSRHKNWEGKCMAPGVECRRWMFTGKKERADSEMRRVLDLTPQDESIPRWDNP
jgi:hypothetical protein